jgi:predicted RNA-binding Zn-ribbon protein involved in translation (DUF1610 family)
MFLCIDNCGSYYFDIFTSRGKCEKCGKIAICWDVPPEAWKAEAARRKSERNMRIIALGTYPCPQCGKVEHVESCTCGTMEKLKARVSHDTDIKKIMDEEETNA